MRRRALVALAHVGRCTGLALTFAGALVAGVFVHAGTPAFRRTVAAACDRVMGELFAGKIDLDDITELSLGRRGEVHARQVKILSPTGTRVVLANDVRADVDLLGLARSLVTGGAPVIRIDRVDVEVVDVALHVDAAGVSEIARAFAPASKDGPTADDASAKAEPRVHIGRASVRSARIHGDLVTPPLDATADDVAAKIDVADGVARMELLEGKVTLRSPRLPGQWQPLVARAKKGWLAVRLEEGSFDGEAEIDGTCGDVPVAAKASFRDGVIEASLDVPEASPEAIASAFGELPITKPVELHANARGRLPALAIEARARAGETDVAANGELSLREGNAFHFEVDASRIDASTFGANVATDLSGKIRVEGILAAPAGTFRVTTAEGTVAGEKVPPAIVEGRFDAERVTATLRTRERGIEASGRIELEVPAKVATFDLQARSDALHTLARAPGVVNGAASARVRGKVNLAQGTVDASMVASGERLRTGALSAGELRGNGRIAGPLASPSIDVELDGADVRVQAPGKEPLVYPRAKGRAKIALVPTPRVLDASIDVAIADDAPGITASARGIRIANGVVEARGLEVRGLGEPLELDAHVGRDGRWSVRAKSAGVDLRRAAAVTGIAELESFPEGTRAEIDVDVREGPEGASGHVDVVLRNETVGPRAVVAETHAKIAHGKLVGTGKLDVEGLARLEITRAELDLPRLDGRSLQRATGTVELRGSIDLAQGIPFFTSERIERTSGIATVEARIERGDPEALPAVRGTVRTRGLEVVLAGGSRSEPVVVSGVDLLAHAEWDGRTEDAEVSLLGWDEHGVLASGAVKSKLPLRWVTDTKSLDATALGSLAIGAVLDVPRRDLTALPPLLRAKELRGGVDAHVRVTGTVARPLVELRAQIAGLDEVRRSQGVATFEPLDGVLHGRWDGERAAITFSLEEREPARRSRQGRPATRPPAGMAAAPIQAADRRARTQRKPGHVRGFVLVTDARMTDVLRRRAAPPWKASAEIEVENVSLGALPLPSDVTGMLTGRASVRDLNGSPSFTAKAHVDDLGAGGAMVRSVDLTVGGRDRSLFVHAKIEDQDSSALVQLASQGLRVHRLDVEWDPTAPTRVDYAVVNGRLALLAPLVRRSISELDGRVDGSGSISLDRTSQVFEGGLALREGRMYLNLIGEEITSVSGIARFEKTGTWRIEGMTGKVGSGEFRASATGRMKGLSFEDAEAIVVASNGGIPLSFEGATFAEAKGEVKLSAKMSEDRKDLLVTIDVPRADVELPDRNAQQLEPLEPDPTITVGIRRKNGMLDTRAVRRGRGGAGPQRTTTSAEGALVTRMTVTLGDAVRLEGRGIDVSLTGRTLVEIAEEVSVTGRIDLRGGSAIVHGRAFTVDRGTITFPEGGDPSNPTIVAAAYWDAPDRTRIWVEFAGPLKTGNLSLRSEPPLTKNEILSVLLFGRPDPNMAAAASTDSTGTPGAASGATAVGSGFVTGDLNRLLAEIDPNLDVETDTLSGNRTRTKLGRSFFDRRLKVQVGYAPGRTMYQPDSTFVFLNWQFIPKWSLVATRGDKGTSILDVLFQHRY